MRKETLHELIEQAYQDGKEKLVVRAVVIYKQQILCIRRLPGDSGGGLYELPGGGVEDGESLFEALMREVQEELGVHVETIGDLVHTCDFISLRNSKRIREFSFLVTLDTYEGFVLQEHDSYIWIMAANLSLYTLTDSAVLSITELIEQQKFLKN